MSEQLVLHSALGHITEGSIFLASSTGTESTPVPPHIEARLRSQLGIREELAGLVTAGAGAVNAALDVAGYNTETRRCLAEQPVITTDGQPNLTLMEAVDRNVGDNLVTTSLLQGAVLLGAAYTGSRFLNETSTTGTTGSEVENVSIHVLEPEHRQTGGTVVFVSNAPALQVGIVFQEPVYKDQGAVGIQVLSLSRYTGFNKLARISKAMHKATQGNRLRVAV